MFKHHHHRRRSEQDTAIHQEYLRQSRLAFNVAIATIIVSVTVSVVGILFLFFGEIPQGLFATTGGLGGNLVSTRCIQLAKEANARLSHQEER